MQSANSNDVLSQLKSFKSACWKPVVRDGDGDAAASKFSGVPMLPKDTEWPKCQNCGQPMQLFIQLNSADLPAEAGTPFGDGILQMFYCTNAEEQCEVECEAFFPFAKSTLLRVVPACEADTGVSESTAADMFPAKTIADWQMADDYPNWEELQLLGIELSEEQAEWMEQQQLPRPGDKLLGWPAWAQGPEYPTCPECDAEMKLLLQIDSNDNLPYSFGDVGCGHITNCPNHPQRLAFGWACG